MALHISTKSSPALSCTQLKYLIGMRSSISLNPLSETRAQADPQNGRTKSSGSKVWLPRRSFISCWSEKAAGRAMKALCYEYVEHDFVIFPPKGPSLSTVASLTKVLIFANEGWAPTCCVPFLRHFSATYKLKLNHGDLRATPDTPRSA